VCIEDNVQGVTQLHNVVYVVCSGSSVINTFNADTLSPLGEHIRVAGMTCPTDMVACRDDRQLYVADYNYCIWRVSADHHSYVKWLPTKSTTGKFHVNRLSVTSRRLLVTSHPPTIRQYSTTDRQLLRVITMPGYVKELFHGVETTRRTFVVGHKGTPLKKELSAVSKIFRFFLRVLATSIDSNL